MAAPNKVFRRLEGKFTMAKGELKEKPNPSIPNKIFIQENDPDMRYGVNQDSGIKGMYAYIRKDLVEHIIRGSLGPQDALNKINSL